MAEREEQDSINVIRKGLFTDTSKEQQPKGTYPFALNAIDESSEGDMLSLSNENSNFNCADIPDSYNLIGSSYLENNTNILFFVDEDTNNSIIATLDKTCKFTELVVSSCLGFSLSNQIESTFRIKNGCERIVYFVDHLNPDRFINLDNLESFLKVGFDLTNPDVNKWDCGLFNIDRLSKEVCISLVEVNEFGGTIPVGVVQFAIQHLDENLNGAGFSDPSATIPITNDSYAESYINIDGAAPNTPTSKSVEINISNIDTNYSYLDLVTIITNGGVTQTYNVDRLNITGTSQNYIFKGLDNYDTFSNITYSKNVYSSKSITQLENRLIRGNIRSITKDYSSIQRNFTNGITSIYSSTAGVTNSVDDGIKTSTYYFNERSYMRDDVYAFGIYYIYDDNTKSPVFHIPGRAKNPIGLNPPVSGDWNNVDSGIAYAGAGQHSRAWAVGLWDTMLHTVVDTSVANWETTIGHTEVEHLGLVIGDTVERWKVYNTAVRHASKEISSATYTGEMAYYEGESLYPTTEDCDGNKIYGDLAGTPIRHHKFPDASLEPHHDGTNKYTLGIQFNNIILPPNTIGYKIVRCDRDSLNRTVLDKGIAHYTRETTSTVLGSMNFQAPFMNKHLTTGASSGDNVVPDGPEAGKDSSVCNTNGVSVPYDKVTFHSPLTKIKSPYLGASFMKTELNAIGTITELGDDEYNTALKCSYNSYNKIKRNSRTNIKINNQAYISGNAIERNALDVKFINNFQTETYAMDLNSAAYIIDDVSNDVYTKAQDWTLSGVTPYYKEDYSGYYSLKSNNVNIHPVLENLIYYTVSTCVTNTASSHVYGGDIFITRLDYKHIVRLHSCDSGDRVNASNVNTYVYIDGTTDKHSYNHIVTFWSESEVNSEMRHEEANQKYYPKSYQTGGDLYQNFLLPSTRYGDYIPNYYNYNEDFTKWNTEVSYIQLPSTWKYCSDCLEEFPNRIVYSEQSFQEEIADHYLTTLPNNYKDIIANRGNITKLYNYKNTVLIDTEESRFVLPSTTKAIKASEENIYVGTGEFFSLPVQEIVDSNVGFMGNQSQWANDVTEHGIFSIDARSGNIFLYNKNMELLSGSKYGMSNYFSEELSLQLPKQYEEEREIEITNIDNPANPYNGVGYTSVFDTRHNRWILTKHDYKLTQAGLDLVNAVTGTERLDYTEGGWKYINLGGSSFIKPSANPDWFENISWTMSFSMNRGSWISWHSYLPTNYIDSKLGFYSVDNKPSIYETSKSIWRHNKKFEYQTFYGTYYPHIIEIVESNNPLQTSLYNSISFITKARQWDSVNKYFVDKRLVTYNKAIIYNNYQNSGLINLLTKREQTSFDRDQESWHQQALLDVNERTYSFNEFRDLVGDYDVPMFTKDWSNSDYRNDYFTDKIINPSSINLNKDWWEQDIFRGKHLVLRLFFSILQNVKLTTQFHLFDKGTTQR